MTIFMALIQRRFFNREKNLPITAPTRKQGILARPTGKCIFEQWNYMETSELISLPACSCKTLCVMLERHRNFKKGNVVIEIIDNQT
jgi:hypothetical protein